jgi:hypothetical protein
MLKGKKAALAGLAVVGGLAAFYYSRLAFAGSKVSFRVNSVRLGTPSLTSLPLQLNCVVMNPSGSTLKIDYLTATVTVGGKTIATIGSTAFAALRAANPEYFVIPAQTDQSVELGVTASNASILQQVISWLMGGGLPSKAVITGNVKIAGIILPINETVNLLS